MKHDERAPAVVLTDAERESLADEISAARIPILSGWRPGWYRVLAQGLAPIIAARVAALSATAPDAGQREAQERAEGAVG